MAGKFEDKLRGMSMQVGEGVAGWVAENQQPRVNVSAALDIAHASLSRLATAAPPTAGLTLSCTRIAMSDHPRPRTRPGDANIALELHYLMTAWSSAPVEEQSILAWAMLELAIHPVLDRSVLVGAGI